MKATMYNPLTQSIHFHSLLSARSTHCFHLLAAECIQLLHSKHSFHNWIARAAAKWTQVNKIIHKGMQQREWRNYITHSARSFTSLAAFPRCIAGVHWIRFANWLRNLLHSFNFTSQQRSFLHSCASFNSCFHCIATIIEFCFPNV